LKTENREWGREEGRDGETDVRNSSGVDKIGSYFALGHKEHRFLRKFPDSVHFF
jgi:hypothetical protein